MRAMFAGAAVVGLVHAWEDAVAEANRPANG
jgi:hypothetical protein